jgi:hypothetical protein
MEEKIKKTRKLLLVALLMFVFAAATGGAYAYWAGTVNYPASATDKSISITVGEATGSVSTQLVVSDPTSALKLVPTGQVGNSVGDATDNVDKKDYDYDVNWETVSGGSAEGAAAKLTMTATDFKINDDTTLGTAYVKVQYHDGTGYVDIPSGGAKFDITADGAAVTVKIRVTLIEPANAADYVAVINKSISIKVSFSVAAS